MTTVLMLIALGIFTLGGECQSNDDFIYECCCLGHYSNNFNAKRSGVYTLWLTGVKMHTSIPTQECIVILAQEEEDGLLFRGGKMEELILGTEIGSSMKMDLEIFMGNFG